MNYPPCIRYRLWTIDYRLPSSIKLLRKTIKTADSDKIWKAVPANARYFISRPDNLVAAVLDLLQQYDDKDEVIIKEDKRTAVSTLTSFETYCGWHTGNTAWDFFPRHLSKETTILNELFKQTN